LAAIKTILASQPKNNASKCVVTKINSVQARRCVTIVTPNLLQQGFENLKNQNQTFFVFGYHHVSKNIQPCDDLQQYNIDDSSYFFLFSLIFL